MHVVFKALGSSFSLIGSLMGSMETEGESKMKMLFDVIGKPEFKGFMSEISQLLSKNPDIMSQFKGDEVTDILSAFRQDPNNVNSTLKSLNAKEKVDKDELMSALKLQTLMGKAMSLKAKAERVVNTKNKEEAKKLLEEIKKVIGEITSLLEEQEKQEEIDN